MKNHVNKNFSCEIKELTKYYFDNSVIQTKLKNDEKKEQFFTEQTNYLGQCLEFILDKPWLTEEIGYFGEWDPKFLLIGHFFEGLLRFILMKELSVELFFRKCFKTTKDTEKKDDEEDNPYYGKYQLFANLIDQIMLLSKVKNLNSKQFKRVKDCLTYINLQRNKHTHNLYKDFGPLISVDYQIFMLIIQLCKIFCIQFQQGVITKLDDAIKNYDEQLKQSLRFEIVW